jgi:shikimate kinase
MTPTEYEKEMIETLRRTLTRPVMLVGLMGSGKTRLGRALAGVLQIEFYDTDRLIEQKAGASINEIFTEHGEQKFRDVERKTVLELLDKGACVIAGGGGAIMNEGVLEALKARAVTIWLKADIKDLLNRLRHAKDRPLLKGGDPEEILKKLAEKREPFYSQADIIFESGMAMPEAVSCLIKGLYGFLKPGNV